METTHTNRISPERLVIGVALMVVGVAGFLGAIDVLHVRELWRLWPLALIVIGLSSETEALRKRRGDGGWILIAIGTWFLIGNFHLFDLSRRSAMPIAIVIAGAFIALHALLDRPALACKENDHE